MPYDGATSLFIRVLLNKKYALPHRVVDALVSRVGRTDGNGALESKATESGGRLVGVWRFLLLCLRGRWTTT